MYSQPESLPQHRNLGWKIPSFVGYSQHNTIWSITEDSWKIPSFVGYSQPQQWDFR
jgi:hypothetical protein